MDEKTLVARAQALVQTMSTPGWQVVIEVASAAVKKAEERVFETASRGESIEPQVHKAQAAREFFRDFQNSLALETGAVTKNNDFIKVTNEVQVPE